MYVSASKINYPPKCNDWGDLNKKVDYEFGAHDKTKALDANGSLAAPFSLYSSSVGTGYNKIIADNFTASVDIANLHFDGITGEVPMQGPFTEQWVGGRQHRHVRLNFSSSGPNTPAGLNGLDHAGKRPEAWRIGFDSSNKALSFSHPGTHRPQARYSRDETAKRPLNIKNIQTVTASTTASVILGNYKNTYEVVQTSGRKINNLAFVADGGFAATATTDSSFISGTMDYTLVVRNPNKAVITERFAAPGGPDVSSNGVLDKTAGEYATNNALTFRNLSVRLPLRSLLTEHCNQFGIRSGSSVSATTYEVDASYHKTHRNALQRRDPNNPATTEKVYDNWYVQHQIPRSDLQYAWISASYSSTKQFGFHTGSDGITFVSASQIGSYVSSNDRYLGPDQNDGPQFLPTDFVDMNHHVYLAITSSLAGASDNTYGTTTITGHSASSTSWTFQGGLTHDGGGKDPLRLSNTYKGPVKVLNTILLNRNGPYQHPTWKQIRTGDHPIARYHKRNNVISIIRPAPWNMLVYRDRKR